MSYELCEGRLWVFAQCLGPKDGIFWGAVEDFIVCPFRITLWETTTRELLDHVCAHREGLGVTRNVLTSTSLVWWQVLFLGSQQLPAEDLVLLLLWAAVQIVTWCLSDCQSPEAEQHTRALRLMRSENRTPVVLDTWQPRVTLVWLFLLLSGAYLIMVFPSFLPRSFFTWCCYPVLIFLKLYSLLFINDYTFISF